MTGFLVCFVTLSFVTLTTSVRIGAKLSLSEKEESTDDTESFNSFADQIRATAATMSGEVQFNETFFRSTCDLSEYTRNPFEGPQYQLSEREEHDDTKWTVGKACLDRGFDLGNYQNNTVQSLYECAQWCAQKSQETAGRVICCERWEQEDLCKAHVGWQDLVDDSHGTSALNPLNWLGVRRPKRARLFYTAAAGGIVDRGAAEEGDQMEQADDDQQFVQTLINEVNHMSIDGILDHLLSFYICMRWIPDQEFVKLAAFELSHIAVDAETPKLAESEVNRDKVLDYYISSSITPLRCSNNMHVQKVVDIDRLLDDLNATGSKLSEIFKFTKSVDQHWRPWWVWGKRDGLNEGLHWDSTKPDQDSIFVQDLRAKARLQDVLPWSTFIRSSMRFEHQHYDDDQRYMICFGPRVSSLPHKRDGGGHVLTDANMAGCNGYWTPSIMIDHINRLKRLFSPELCFEDKLRRELKQQFLTTFVRMNQEFEQAMFGKYTKRLHDLDPTNSKKLELLTDRTVNITETLSEEEQSIFRKFKRTAGLVAKAHSKWVICETQDNVSSEPFGTEDNFFRDPSAYQRWLGKVFDDTVPECRTLDPTTGCVKCVVAVKNKHDCHIRLNVTFDTLVTALRENKWPFLLSKYRIKKEVITETGRQIVEEEKQAACMVRKSGITASNAAQTGNIEDIKNAFFQVNDTDGVVRMNFTSATDAAAQRIESTYHYEIKARRESLAEWVADGGVTTGPVDDLLGNLQEENYQDLRTKWAEKFIFTDDIEEISNVMEHKVDYFVSCPCSKSDFTPNKFFEEFRSQGMHQYING